MAECLRQAGGESNTWALPGAQSIYVMKDGVVVQQGEPLMTGVADIAPFDEKALISALRKDQVGESTFAQFLTASWEAGVVGYKVDFSACTVHYYGARGEEYTEAYPAVEVNGLIF